MDTLTHAVIGMAVASLSGQPFTFDNPIYLATLLGAQAPDFDIIALFRGNFAFLKQHRSLSHSLLGLVGWSTLISSTVYFFMSNTSLMTLVFWALLGALSHVIADYFNTHGAAILWPICKKRKSLQLLNVFDPLLLAIMVSLFLFKLPPLTFGLATFSILGGYITLRLYLRSMVKKQLIKNFMKQNILRLSIMPSLKKVFNWDFIIETETYHYIGQIKSFSGKIEFQENLPRQEKLTEITQKAENTTLGSFFSTFTPFAYYEEKRTVNALHINIYDLRYYLNEQFIHRATIVFNEKDSPSAAYLYSEGKTIQVPC